MAGIKITLKETGQQSIARLWVDGMKLTNNRKLEIKKIVCLDLLDNSEENEDIKGVITGKTYTFGVIEYGENIPTEDEKERICWLVIYSCRDYKSSTGNVAVVRRSKKGGDTFSFDIPNDITSNNIRIFSYFKDKEKEASLELPLVDKCHIIVGFEIDEDSYKELYNLQTIYLPNSATPSIIAVKDRSLNFLVDDVGHAFFYIVKNNLVQQFFSFGPVKPKSIFRQGTPDYHLRDKTHLFRIPISYPQYISIMDYTNIARERIISGDKYYNIFNNYTCASSTKEILDKIIPKKIPYGRGHIAVYYIDIPFDAIHPYAWYNSFIESQWKNTEKTLPENEELWEYIMNQCKKNDKPDDPYITR